MPSYVLIIFSPHITMHITVITLLIQSYQKNGWICSHVLASMHADGAINLKFLLSQLLVRRGSGRPPKRLECLKRQFENGAIDTTELQPAFFRYQKVRRNVLG